jgi:hypothetical protein
MIMPTTQTTKNSSELVSNISILILEPYYLLKKAKSLAGRYCQAAETFQEAEEYYKNLCSTVDENVQQSWRAEISTAENNRFQTPDAMDIMGSRQTAVTHGGPSASNQSHDSKGEEWISLALTVEERQ